LIFLSMVLLIGWIAISLDPNVDGRLDWAQSSGHSLLMEEMFVLFAAGIGATFSILFQVNRLVVCRTYDLRYDSTFWTRLVLGIVAGMLLAFLIPLDTTSELQKLTKPTLAMLGGFSVTVVYRILQRLVAAVEALVRGDTQDIIEAQSAVARSNAEAALADERIRLSSSLIRLRAMLESHEGLGEIQDSVDTLIRQCLQQDQAPTRGAASAPGRSAPDPLDG
jgi:pimeloyl-ACP methyl ester carboxylesterase